MKIKNGFVVREVGGESVVVPVGEMSKQFHGMINLNETGAFLWAFFTQEHSVDEAVQALLGEYDVEESIARADVEQYAKNMRESVSVELYRNGTKVSQTYTASVEGIAKLQTDAGRNTDVIKAMLKYGDAASAYFN